MELIAVHKTDRRKPIINALELTRILKEKWDEVHSYTNVFRYKIHNIEQRIVDKYLLQLNPNRITKRRTPEQIVSISQQFDKNKFNFTKISNEEILFELKNDNNGGKHIFVVNVSPISQYHILLCPSIDKCLPQLVTKDSLKLVIDLLLLGQDSDLRVAFNSLCALASVNHLHYHFFIEKNTLPIEKVKCKHINGPLYCLVDYPVPGFCFEITKQSPKTDEIYKLIEFFVVNSIAHNIFFTRGDYIQKENEKHDEILYRCVIWPRKSSSGVKQLSAFNVAACELSGWFVIHDTEEFRTLRTEQLEQELRKWSIDNFEELCEQLKLLY